MKEIRVKIDASWDQEELRKKIGFVSEGIIGFVFMGDYIDIKVADDEDVESITNGIINIAEKTLRSNDAEVRYNSSKCSKKYYAFEAFASIANLKNGSIKGTVIIFI